MKNIVLEDVDVKPFLNESIWGRSGFKFEQKSEEKTEDAKKLTESEEVVEESEVQEEEHVCPLCESKLESPISREALSEFTEMVLEALNEATDVDEEVLEESEEVEDEDESESEEE